MLILSRPDGRSTGHIPEPDGAVPTGGGQRLSIGTEGDGTHAIGMAPHGQVRHPTLLVPDAYLPASTAHCDVAPIGADRHGHDRIESFGEDRVLQRRPGKPGILHLDALQVGPANSEPGEVQAAQVAAQFFEQADDVGGAIALRGGILGAELREQAQQVGLDQRVCSQF